jgi:hypothetical protein
MDSYVFRRAFPEDAEEIYFRLNNDDYILKKNEVVEDCDLFEGKSVDQIRKTIADDNSDKTQSTWVVTESDDIIGIVLLSHFEDLDYFEANVGGLTYNPNILYKTLYVAWRCSFARQSDLYPRKLKGVGRAIQKGILSTASDLYPDRYTVVFNTSLPRAQNFHRRIGMTPSDEKNDFFLKRLSVLSEDGDILQKQLYADYFGDENDTSGLDGFTIVWPKNHKHWNLLWFFR